MAKKTWIKTKRGFIDPKHQTAIGEAIWLYLYLIDNANWETGVVSNYTDRQASEDLGIPQETIRKQRYRLKKAKYIDCAQGKHKQFIMIGKWTNPRKYDGEIINDPPDIGVYLDAIKGGNHGGHELPPLDEDDSNGGHHGGHNGMLGVATPPFNSESQDTIKEDSLSQIWQRVRYAAKTTINIKSPNSKAFRYIDATELVSLTEDEAIIKCLMQPEEMQLEWLDDRMKSKIENSFVGVLARRISVQFIDRDESKKE